MACLAQASSRSKRAARLLPALLVGCLVPFHMWTPEASRVLADEVELDLGPFSIDDKNPSSTVPTPQQALQNPMEMGYLMITLAERADGATAKGDHKQAAEYYLAIAKAAPDRAIGMRKACESFEASGDMCKAFDACRAALGRGGLNSADFLKFVNLALKQKTLSAGDLSDVDSVIAQVGQNMGKTPKSDWTVTNLKCQLAVRTEDVARLEACSKAVKSWAPGDKQRFVYSSLAGLAKADWEGVAQLIRNAEKAGVPAEVVTRMKETLATRQQLAEEALASRDPLRKWWPALLALITAGLAAGIAVVRRRLPDAA
jgi:hypothetical protein